jgi:uncharacterized protein (DUF3820 family)
MKMPFGKFSGVELDELPDAYLRWLLSIEITNDLLAAELQLEAEARGFFTKARGRAPRSAAPAREVVDELVGAGLRSLARKYHPDCGGDTRRMQEVTGAADWLRQQARALA